MDNILENANISFHGINFDYFKMISILETGILSQNAATSLGISIDRNYDGYNENSQVSLSESPSIHDTYNHGAFNAFVKNGISFVIDTSNMYCIQDNKSGIPGEIYVDHSVPRENIIGIMLPEQYLQTSIDKLNIFGDMGTGYVDDYALNFVDKINSLFETSFSNEEIIDCIEKKKNLSGDFFDKMKQEKDINQQINRIITKFFDLGFRTAYQTPNSPTLLDTITILTDGKIPIYANNGNLITERKNKTL